MKVFVKDAESSQKALGFEVGDGVGPLLAALSGAEWYKRGWAADSKWTPVRQDTEGRSIEVVIVDETDIAPRTKTMDELTASVKAADDRWLDAYNRANKAEKRVKELEGNIEALTAGLNGGGEDDAAAEGGES